MARTARACWFLVALTTLAVSAIGCGSDRPARVPVSGRVVIDGQPIEHGAIRLVPPDARPSVGKLGPGGRFQLTCFGGDDGSVLGTHRVTVTAVESLGPNRQRWHAPKKYADLETSPLEVEIDGPTEDLRIELSWDGGEPFVENLQESGP